MTAAEKATEALRDAETAIHSALGMVEEANFLPDWDYLRRSRTKVREALAALTAEQAAVPPDREALARKCLEYADAYAGDSYDAGVEIVFREAAAALRSPASEENPALRSPASEEDPALRSPASEEVEAMTKRLQGVAAIIESAGIYNAPETVLREAIALLRRLSPADGWRPIESAPKDGTKVDLLYPYPRGRKINCAWTDKLSVGWHWKTPEWKNGVLLPESKWNTSTYPNMQPTHWMPSPAPPSSETEEK